MNKVRKIYDDTVKLIEVLENKSEMDRDEKIKMINECLEKREKEIIELASPYSEEEKDLGRSLVLLNQKLARLLDSEKLLIQQDMKDLHTKKELNKKYTNPYKSLVTGGVFYDKRN